MIDLASRYLFRAHVPDRSEDRVCRGQSGLRRRARRTVASLRPLVQFRETEIQNLYVPVTSHDKILRLQIAVNDTALVRRGQAITDVDGVLDRFVDRHGVCDHLAQGDPIEQFRNDIRLPVVNADVVYREDIRVIQGRRSTSLLFEPPDDIRVVPERHAHDLEGHLAV